MQKIPLHAKNTANKAMSSVPAYQKSIIASGRKIKIVMTDKDFLGLPIIDKKSYIYNQSFSELIPKNHILPPFAYASSGSSGTPTFWFLGDEHEAHGATIHEKIFHDTWGIVKKQKTLVIITFSMGVWVAGNYTLASIRGVARKGYNVTVVTPGIEKNDTLDILRKFAVDYDNIVFCGYPPFLMNLMHEVHEQKINLQTKNLFALAAGDKFTESWRNEFLKLINKTNDPSSVIGIYGSADAVIMGFETATSIFIRRAATKNKSLYKELFGNEQILPSISQFDPNKIFFETIDDELVLTEESSIPLVRYNIHDKGAVFSFDQMVKILSKYNLEKEITSAKLKAPFVVVKGRTDVATTFYALNIYPENIRAVVEDREIRHLFSGNFFVYSKDTKNSRFQKLYVELELARGVGRDSVNKEKVVLKIIKYLSKLNIEYRKLRNSIGKKANPRLILLPNQSKDLSRVNTTGLLNIKGKKPKVVLK